MTLVFLPTDIMVFFLMGVCGVAIVWASRRPRLCQQWRRVFERPLAMAACVVLSLYLVVGVLDSIHFQPHHRNHLVSLLDGVMAPVGAYQETTYSPPFAVAELKHAGMHLKPGQNRTDDIVRRLSLGVVQGLGISGVLLMIVLFARARHCASTKRAQTQPPHNARSLAWRTCLVTLSVVFIGLSIVYQLAPHYHILGTDKVGNDVFFESVKSIRTGLVIGTVTTLLMLPFGLILGTWAGYFKGFIDDLIQYIYTTLSAIPAVLLISAAILSLQVYLANHPEHFSTLALRADVRLLGLCVLLGVTSWTQLCRLVRAETLKLKSQEFIQAAKVLGLPHHRIIRRHVVPNVMHIVLITLVLDFSALVLAEAVLSYVGVGVDPTTMSWGNMINSARLELAREPVVWWPLLAAFLLMFGLVLSANVFADAVRDAFDTKR